MTAQETERVPAGARVSVTPAAITPRMITPTTTTATTRSSSKAYDRRTRRHQTVANRRLTATGSPIASTLSRVPFVALIILLLAGGIVGVLWLNTMSDAAGLRASQSKLAQMDLDSEIEAAQKDIAALQDPALLDAKARQLGLVPPGDAAMLIIGRDGKGTVLGTPTPVPAAGAATTVTSGQATAPAIAAPATAAPTTAPASTTRSSTTAAATSAPATTKPSSAPSTKAAKKAPVKPATRVSSVPKARATATKISAARVQVSNSPAGTAAARTGAATATTNNGTTNNGTTNNGTTTNGATGTGR